MRIDGDVVRLLQDIDLNRIEIDQNLADITSNAANTAVLQTDVQSNRNRIGTNARNIKDMGKQVDLLIDGTSTNMPDISVCAPLWATVNSEMSGLGYRSYSNCGTSCRPPLYPCPQAHGTRVCEGPSSRNPVEYMRRDVSTLNCQTLRANFYTRQYCRRDFTGNPCR